MELICIRCNETFDSGVVRGYCDGCIEAFRERRKQVAAKENPSLDVHVTGQFAKPCECPQTVGGDGEPLLCGICGGDDFEYGYGFAGGYGLGSYLFCVGCNTVLDFSEDKGG